MGDDDRDCFDSSRLLVNDARFVTSIPIYQTKLKLFSMLPIQRLIENRAQYLFILARISLLNTKMLLFGRSKGAV